ncbi:TetR/AcrR family transcriptional regulator [Nonomuraea sp. NPDC050663]|uniref:TetR/AcrR family transcriptional regulator n=1 Tax=Nonomuraea sp. NPDC050663 TaxID=3364370 RepID=UPI0037B16859
MRRTPVQQRSVERVNQMLDAAAELLEEGGYDALSTRALAARTGLPIGSIYRYFSDKRALAEALTRRNLERFRLRLEQRLEGVTRLDTMIDVVVAEYLDMKAKVPGFAVMDFGDNSEVAGELAGMVSALLGVPLDDRLRRTVLAAVEAADALLRAHHDDPEMIEETKELLRAYLGRRLSIVLPP